MRTPCSCPSTCHGDIPPPGCRAHGCGLDQADAFDADVLLCTIDGVGHDWRPEDRTPPGVSSGNPYYVCAVCVWCRAARCGHLTDEDPCLLPRHHTQPHRYRSGASREVGA